MIFSGSQGAEWAWVREEPEAAARARSDNSGQQWGDGGGVRGRFPGDWRAGLTDIRGKVGTQTVESLGQPHSL